MPPRPQRGGHPAAAGRPVLPSVQAEEAVQDLIIATTKVKFKLKEGKELGATHLLREAARSRASAPGQLTSRGGAGPAVALQGRPA